MFATLITAIADRIAFITALSGGMHRATAILARFDWHGRPKTTATQALTDFTNTLVKDSRGQVPTPISFRHGGIEQVVVESTHLRLGDSVVLFVLAHRKDRPDVGNLVHVLCWDYHGKQMRYVLASVAKTLNAVLPRHSA